MASLRKAIPGGWRDVATVLDRALAESPAAEALVGRHQRYSYGELDSAVNSVAAALRALGVKVGDRVAATMANHPDIVIAFLATQRIGAVWLGINRALAPPEKLFQLQDSEARVYLADKDAAEQIAGLRAQLPALEHVVKLDAKEERESWHRMLEEHASGPGAAIAIDPHAPAAIAYTSGTTGRPKGAVHSQHNMMVVAAAGLAGMRGGHWRPRLRHGVYLPFTILNLLILDAITALAGVGACVCMDRADAAGVAEWIEREKVQAINSAPATVFDLVRHPDILESQLVSIEFISCGGAMVSGELTDAFAAKFGKPMYAAYGLTEAPTSVAGHVPERKALPGSCGFPYRHLRVAIFDRENREARLGEVGELCVSATETGEWAGVYTPMLGYWRRPEASADCLRNGWLHTGDAAIMDEEGNIFLQDRLKDVIIRGGSNVYPAEVERILKLDGRVRDAAVVGKLDKRLGEVVVAFIELVPGVASSHDIEAELKSKCLGELARYKVPEIWVFVPQMPRNSMNKVVKGDLLTHLEDKTTT